MMKNFKMYNDKYEVHDSDGKFVLVQDGFENWPVFSVNIVDCLCCGYTRLFLSDICVTDIVNIITKYVHVYNYQLGPTIAVDGYIKVKMGWYVKSGRKVAIKFTLTEHEKQVT